MRSRSATGNRQLVYKHGDQVEQLISNYPQVLRACEKIPARSEGASGRVWQGAGVPIAGSVASSK